MKKSAPRKAAASAAPKSSPKKKIDKPAKATSKTKATATVVPVEGEIAEEKVEVATAVAVEEPPLHEQIGAAAGLVWHALRNGGPMTIAKLVKDVDAPRDLVMHAIGWLAREDKLIVEEVKGQKAISLRPE